jgi:hypothetical protein
MSKAAELAALIANVNKGSSLANKNFIINGAMNVAQRGTSATGKTSAGYYSADRWRLDISSAGTWTQIQSTDVPTGQGFSNSTKLDCTTADGSLGASDRVFITQRIEDQNCVSSAKGTSDAKSLTASFWVKSNKTGTYILELYDSHNSRHISKSYTISSADTWEYKTITFAGDTTGAFANDNGIGFMLQFWLAAGSDYTSGTLATSWQASDNTDRAVGQLNLADSTDNEWLLTGVQLEIGEKATEFEVEPFSVTLQKAQRYFCRTYTYGVATGTATVLGAVVTQAEVTSSYSGAGTWEYPVEMRAAPTITIYSTQNADTTAKITADGTDGNGVTFGIGSQSVFLCRNNDGSGVAVNVFMKANATAYAEL